MDVRTGARAREARSTIPVYPQLPFVPHRAAGCDLFTEDGRQILDLYGGHAVACLGYGHPELTRAIAGQARRLLFQSNAVALNVRAEAAEKLVAIAPESTTRAFFVNSGAEANDNALRMALTVTARSRVLAVTHGFHGRTAAAGAVTWNAQGWYGFPQKPFAVDFIPRDDADAAAAMIGDDVAAVIVEPIQGVAGAYDLSAEFLTTIRETSRKHGALLIADEVQSGMGRSGQFFAMQTHELEPDILTSAKSLAGGLPAAAVLVSDAVATHFPPGSLGTTFGGGPVAAAAIVAVIDAIETDKLLANVRAREIQIRADCRTGPVEKIQGMGLMLGLVCDRPAVDVRDALLEHDILAGTSSDPKVLRILAPLVLEADQVDRLKTALADIPPARL